MLMRVGKFLALVLGLIVAVLLHNAAIHLMSVPNDGAVIGGVVLLVSIYAVFAYLAVQLGKKLWHKYKDIGPGAGAVAIIVLCVFNAGCYTIVEPGHVGLLVKQTGTDRGVQDYPLQTGRVFYNPWNENVLVYPTSVQRAIWTKSSSEGHQINEEVSFQSKEGIHFTADVNCSYELEREKVPHFYIRFRNDDIDGFTHGFLRDTVRNSFDVATGFTAEEINGSRQGELIAAVGKKVVDFMTAAGIGVHIVQIGFAAPPRPPDQVARAIEGKVAAIQDAEKIKNQVQSSINEGERIKALANANAEANRVTQASITPTLVEWEKIKKWDGRLSQVSGANALVNIK